MEFQSPRIGDFRDLGCRNLLRNRQLNCPASANKPTYFYLFTTAFVS